MKEKTLQRISQTKWMKKVIMLLTIAIMISASAVVTLAAPPGGIPAVANAALGDVITIDGEEWIKIRELDYSYGGAPPNLITEPKALAQIIRKNPLPGGTIYYGPGAGSGIAPLYKNSYVRTAINSWYSSANIPTIKANALQHRLSYFADVLSTAGNAADVQTNPITVPAIVAAGKTQLDIAFAPAYGEAKLYESYIDLSGKGVILTNSFTRTIYGGSGYGQWGSWSFGNQGVHQINSVITAGVRPSVWVYQGQPVPEPKILSLSTAPITTLIANHPARLPVTLTGTGLTGKTATFSLVNSAGVPVYSYGPVAVSNNFYEMKNIAASALTIPYGQYTFKVTIDGSAATASVPLTIAEDLDSYWTFKIKASPYNGQLTLVAVFDLGGYDTVQVVGNVYVNNVLVPPTDYIVSGNSVWFPNGPTSGKVKIRFEELRYPTLVPDYSISMEKTETL
ncbi:MAG: hypothetical protein LBT22_08565 [Peptococcaceae bacterium]|jgi:hypothetical protein|nr:hypothetical protein [Peptococcaceae bacterium]